MRAQLGNDIAIKAFKEGKLPFPDGAIIAAIHWTRVPSEDNNKVLDGPFPGTQSFVIGSPVNVQFMVKDSKKYAATGGWGFADFKDGKPGEQGAARNLLSLPHARERSRFCLHPLRTLIPRVIAPVSQLAAVLSRLSTFASRSMATVSADWLP